MDGGYTEIAIVVLNAALWIANRVKQIRTKQTVDSYTEAVQIGAQEEADKYIELLKRVEKLENQLKKPKNAQSKRTTKNRGRHQPGL